MGVFCLCGRHSCHVPAGCRLRRANLAIYDFTVLLYALYYAIKFDILIINDCNEFMKAVGYGFSMKRLVIGILAHVDAGKTTLSEGILYTCHSLKKLGRVDKKDSFLDNYALERERGITIFSKQAVFRYEDICFTLLDTPGHVDFSAEMERTLAMLDVAVLVVSGPEGVQAHTRTLWKLLKSYDVPTFIFVNKMDRDVVSRGDAYNELRSTLSKSCVDVTDLFVEEKENASPAKYGFSKKKDTIQEIHENIALCDEELLESFLETGSLEEESVRELVGERKMYPVVFGSALKLEGVDGLLEALKRFSPMPYDEERFAARIYKIGRDSDGKRLTYMKITGGCLKNRDVIAYYAQSEGRGEAVKGNGGSVTGNEEEAVGREITEITEKITEIRVYNGDKYESVDKAEQGMVVAVTGLGRTQAGEVLGNEEPLPQKQLTPVLTYRVVETDRSRLMTMLPRLKLLDEEEPQLHVVWNMEMRELQVRIMGEIQLEVLKSRYREKFNEEIEFDRGSILYRETLKGPVLGVGHYEPLRHYAEVQLVLEPGEPGSGITFKSVCPVNELETNWQRLIMTHVYEREHKGCRIGAVLDDVCITLVAGRAHLKHTEGGDFRQATYRAIRQGLMRALYGDRAEILEPYYEFTLELPRRCIGRAMNDIEQRCGKITGQYEADYAGSDGGAEPMVVLTGRAPVATMQGYVTEVTSYTKGLGLLYCTYYGYLPCHNASEVAARVGYDASSDMRNPSYSVFCAHGSGFPVEWDRVDDYKHIDCRVELGSPSGGEWQILEKNLTYGRDDTDEAYTVIPVPEFKKAGMQEDTFVSVEEVDSILNRTFYANRKDSYKNPFRKHRINAREQSAAGASSKTGRTLVKSDTSSQKEKYLLVDGYNIIFAWDELRELAAVNIDGARDRLNDILCNFRAMHDFNLIVVYDAYRVAGHQTEYFGYKNIKVVYTREAEIADRYIERFVHDNAGHYNITVATSDGLEQIIIRGQGAALWSARDLLEEVKRSSSSLEERYLRDGGKIGTQIGAVIEEKNRLQV